MPLLIHALIAFVATALLLPWLARGAGGLGLLDVPTARSTHTRPVARVGGIGLVLGVAIALLVAVVRGHALLDASWTPYLLPAGLYFLIGLVDDRVRLGAAPKFLAQAGAAALAVGLGLRWDGAALGPFGEIAFGPLTPFMTWLWLVAVVTLVNFVDGIDLITAATAVVVLGAAAGGEAGPGDGALHALTAAGVLGLALWNAAPARVFPGDAGTHLLGFLMASAACGVPGAAASEPLARGLPWAAASAPLVPGVIDVAMGLWGKARRGVSLAAAHSDHLHQRLTKVGWSHAASALRYGALSLCALLLVTFIARDAGLGACLGIAAVVLVWHLASALLATRGVRPSADGAAPG